MPDKKESAEPTVLPIKFPTDFRLENPESDAILRFKIRKDFKGRENHIRKQNAESDNPKDEKELNSEIQNQNKKAVTENAYTALACYLVNLQSYNDYMSNNKSAITQIVTKVNNGEDLSDEEKSIRQNLNEKTNQAKFGIMRVNAFRNVLENEQYQNLGANNHVDANFNKALYEKLNLPPKTDSSLSDLIKEFAPNKPANLVSIPTRKITPNPIHEDSPSSTKILIDERHADDIKNHQDLNWDNIKWHPKMEKFIEETKFTQIDEKKFNENKEKASTVESKFSSAYEGIVEKIHDVQMIIKQSKLDDVTISKLQKQCADLRTEATNNFQKIYNPEDKEYSNFSELRKKIDKLDKSDAHDLDNYIRTFNPKIFSTTETSADVIKNKVSKLEDFSAINTHLQKFIRNAEKKFILNPKKKKDNETKKNMLLTIVATLEKQVTLNKVEKIDLGKAIAGNESALSEKQMKLLENAPEKNRLSQPKSAKSSPKAKGMSFLNGMSNKISSLPKIHSKEKIEMPQNKEITKPIENKISAESNKESSSRKPMIFNKISTAAKGFFNREAKFSDAPTTPKFKK